MTDFDSPWKEALDLYLQAFLEFFFPQVAAALDWSRAPEALDTELQQVAREAALGRRQVDRLYKVWLREGHEVWLLIHVEVHTQRDEAFAERMFVYHYRLYDRERRPVVSLAVLGDEHPAWRPSRFGYNVCGCAVGLEFPTVKLLDYGADCEALEAGDNPFGPLVLAHLKTLETRGDAATRYAWKFRVIRGLYGRGFGAEQVWQLFRLIDWLMDLPVDLDVQLRQELLRLEEGKQMPYVTSIERLAVQRGREEGLAEGKVQGLAEGKVQGLAEGKAESLLQILEQRFPTPLPVDLAVAVRECRDLGQLQRGLDLVLQVASLDEFRTQAQL